MHILMIPSWYAVPGNPLRGIFFREQAEALREAGHQVGVITVVFNFRSLKTIYQGNLLPTISLSTENGIPVYRIYQQKFGRVPGWLHLLVLRLANLAAYRQYVREWGRPDVIQAHSILYGGYMAVDIKEKYGVPVVLTEHSSAFLRGLINPDSDRIIRLTLVRSNRTFAVSRALVDALKSYAPDQEVEVLGNLVDGDFFTLASRSRSPDQPFIFTNVSILTKNKGLDTLLQAFAQACSSKNVQLRIAGDGEELNNLKTLAENLGILDQVEFLGFLDRVGVRDLLLEVDALVSASQAETFGITLIEAMSCGRPVITTRSGGPEDFVDASNGLIVPPGDVSALAQALTYMIDHYADYDPAQIRADILAKYGKDTFVQRMERIYQEVIQR